MWMRVIFGCVLVSDFHFTFDITVVSHTLVYYINYALSIFLYNDSLKPIAVVTIVLPIQLYDRWDN